MEKKKIRDLAKGEYFILNPIGEPNASQVWVRGEYIREAKKYRTNDILKLKIMSYTVEDLIGALEEMDPQAPVMVAVQPSWPFEHSITGVINAQNGTVSLASKQEGYLPQKLKKLSKRTVSLSNLI